MRLPDGSGIDLLRLVRQWDERSAAVMISGHGTVADAVEATRIGAFDFLEPLARDRVLLVVKTRSSGRTCSARTSVTGNWSGTRRG